MCAVAGSICVAIVHAAESPGDHFDRQVAPLLAGRCLECHNPGDKKGGLDLTTRDAALTGGEGGSSLEPGDAEASYLWQRVLADEMPPKKPLADAEKTLLEDWIRDGAAWGTTPIDRFRYTSGTRAGYDWWSLQPLSSTKVPSPKASSPTFAIRNPIDAFVLDKLNQQRLAPSTEADRRALIRRLSFDLLGLPPTPEEIASFVADTSADAYERLVDRLLASPHYGERWARHWLDVARFGESDGFEYDRLRPNAWVYRDWVVNALNDDLPYDEFARQQIAGDVLRPEDASATVASGFLVCGAHDALIPAGDIMRQIMRQDEMEDLVGTVAQTFVGLTANCARCHDHKFDPIRQSEYYQLASALAGVARGDRELPTLPPADASALQTQLAAARSELRAIEQPAISRVRAEREQAGVKAVRPVAKLRWDFVASADSAPAIDDVELLGGAAFSAEGLVLNSQDAYAQTKPLPFAIREKTLEARMSLANLTQRGGAAISLQTPGGDQFDAIVFGERQPGHWMAGSESFQRTRELGGTKETSAAGEFVHIAITYAANGDITCYRNGIVYGKPYNAGPPLPFDAGQSQIVFGLRHAPVGAGKLLSGIVRDAAIYDRALTAEEVAATAGVPNQIVTDEQLFNHLSAGDRQTLNRLREQIKSLERQLDPPRQKAFVVTPVAAAVTHRLERGNPLTKGEVVTPGGIASLRGLPADFGLKADAPDKDRRQKLAEWITSPQNPLFARVMVNRIWHYHFGVGIVDTPNDFGFGGGRPSHPELLDWLAQRFIEDGFRLKSLHRLIVVSSTYRQASLPNAAAMKVDAGGRLLWRFPPRRLEAEVVRDAVLAVSGELNLQRGGPGFQDFDLQNQANTAVYVPRDVAQPEFQRRSLYRVWARGARHPLLDAFDCPDTTVTSPSRGVTTTPLQALSLFNNSFMLRMSQKFSERAAHETDGTLPASVDRLYRLALGRALADAERKRVESFAKEFGLPALCRALLNSNEFLYVE